MSSERDQRTVGAVAVTQEVDAALADAEGVFTGQQRAEGGGRRRGRPGGRRSVDRPINAWSTGQLGYHIGMGSDFVVGEIEAGEIKASQFGVEWRIHKDEVRRYLNAKGWPLPEWMRP